MLATLLVLFCRITLGLVFSISAISKIFKMQPFVKAVVNFEILPNRLARFAAYLFVIGEFLTAILLGMGCLTIGFSLVSLLLLVFSSALVVALWRKMRISCNCFGPTQTIISVYDLWRNGGFVICAIVGLIALERSSTQQDLIIWDVMLVTFSAVIFVTIWTNLNDIAWLLQQSNQNKQ